MQRRRLLKLAAALRARAGRKMFDLSSWGYRRGEYVHGSMAWNPSSKDLPEAFRSGGGCGTTACIAGMAAAIGKGWTINWAGPGAQLWYKGHEGVTGFAVWAGIPIGAAELLCIPQSGLWDRCGWGAGYRPKPTALQAAGVIERYVKTGKLVGPRRRAS